MNNGLTFCDMALDRASALRKNPLWLREQFLAQDALFFYHWRGKFLFHDLRIAAISREFAVLNSHKNCSNVNDIHYNCTFPDELSDEKTVVFLGLKDTYPVFVWDLSMIEEEDLASWLERFSFDNAKFIDFRHSLSLLSQSDASILGYAKSLIHWHQSATYCGTCGGGTHSLDGGHRRVCQHSVCAKEHFPRTDPVVIMLVEYQPKLGPKLCLLAEHHRTPENVFSTLAGFVDPGESLQEAVIREVKEEAGIEVNNVVYVDSQPWPFPNSIMLGFVATTLQQELCIDQDELRNAQWFSAKQLSECGEWGDESEQAKLPRKESIARMLIDKWCAEQID
jgi:NAD+ diphosphatase